jgi:hypothetical protein
MICKSFRRECKKLWKICTIARERRPFRLDSFLLELEIYLDLRLDFYWLAHR